MAHARSMRTRPGGTLVAGPVPSRGFSPTPGAGPLVPPPSNSMAPLHTRSF